MAQVTQVTPEEIAPGISLPLRSLIDLRHDIVRNKTSNQIVRSGFPGQRLGTRRGQGLEFIDLRQYNDADDVRHIDWNVTARTNEPYTRLYQEEREHVSTVIVDLRPLMFNGSECLRAVAAGRMAGALLWQANHSGDRTSAIVISSSAVRSTRPASGIKGVLQALELIANGFDESSYVVESNREEQQTTPSLADAVRLTNRSSSYFLFSGFDDDNYTQNNRALPLLDSPGRLTAILLLDKLEQQALPAGTYRYKSGRASRQATHINASNSVHFANAMASDVRSRQQSLKAAGVPLITIETTTAPAGFLSRTLHLIS